MWDPKDSIGFLWIPKAFTEIPQDSFESLRIPLEFSGFNSQDSAGIFRIPQRS